MEAALSHNLSVKMYHHIPEGIALQRYCRENLKSQYYYSHFRRACSMAEAEKLG
jgi:hypothetical protein